MPRWLFLLTFLTTISPHVAAAEPLPNVVLVMADDMGWGDVAYNGHPVVKTPNLDALSRTGLRFDRFYAPTVCSPTRGSCLTGRHPFRYGITNANVGKLPEEEQTIAELLKARGYATGHFGKWHLGTLTNDIQDGRRGGKSPAEYSPPWLHGFNVAFSTEQAIGLWDPGDKPVFNTHYWTGPGQFATTNLEGDDSRVIVDRVVPFLRDSVESKKPFLAVVWFHAPHEPVKAGPAYRAMYADRSPREQNYFGCITAMDEQVGRLRQELRDLNVAGNTLFWFCSDNGPEGKETAPGSGGPFRGRKRDLLEGGVRVPSILEWPDRFRAPRIIDPPVVTSDFLPTILDFLAIQDAAKHPLDGASVKEILEGTASERPKPIGFEYAGATAWLDGRYKLIGTLDETPSATGPRPIRKLALYDLVADPHEDHNVAADLPERVAAMQKELAAWRQSCFESARGSDYR